MTSKLKFLQNFAWCDCNEYKLAFALIVAAEETVEPTPSRPTQTSSNQHKFGMLFRYISTCIVYLRL